jgi:hypothetical protein
MWMVPVAIVAPKVELTPIPAIAPAPQPRADCDSELCAERRAVFVDRVLCSRK